MTSRLVASLRGNGSTPDHQAPRTGVPGPGAASGDEREGPVPPSPMLVSVAGWSWRALVVGAAVLVLLLLLSRLLLAVVPVAAALFCTALLHRPARALVRLGVPERLAGLVALLFGAAVIGAAVYFTTNRIVGQADVLTGQVDRVVADLKALLDRLPGESGLRLSDLVDRAVSWLRTNRMTAVQEVVAVGRGAAEVLTGIVLTIFLTYFFIVDGERMWGWCVRLLPGRVRQPVNGAGHRAWGVLAGWIRGSAVIATIHGVVIGLVLWLLGVPLALPLALLVFIGSFFPIVGALVFGGLALLVTLLTTGLVPALVFFGVLVVEDQLEAHVLQPFIIGRAVHLHPVAIVLVLTVGGGLGGILGAIVAVPVAAALHAAVKYLTGVEDVRGRRLDDVDRLAPLPPSRSAPLPGYGPGHHR